MFARAICALSLLTTSTALAQDIEYLDPDFESSEESKLTVSGMFETQWHEYNNLDFRLRDETSDQTILDSDDRNSFAFSGASLALAYEADPRTTIGVAVAHRGLWGNDQIGNINPFGGFLWFSALFVEHRFGTGDNAVSFKVGRQFFDIGGMPSNDYVLADVLDMVRVDVPLGDVGSLVIIPMNVAGLSSGTGDANFVSFIGQNTTQTFGFRGDHMTRRSGAVLILDKLVENLDVRAYGFYTDIGALGSGSDISYNGALGNFSDNDWVMNAGVRGSYDAGVVTPYAHFDYSNGVDRKEEIVPDVATTGFAFGGGANIELGDDDAGFRGDLGYFQATGGSAGRDGLMFNHGYVGMKARQVGGILGNRFLGWHPTAYVGMFGISDNPQDTSRKAGMRVIEAHAGYDFGRTAFDVGYWFMQDTATSSYDRVAQANDDAPFGYSREELFAQERFGAVLGHEINGHVDYDLTERFRLQANGGVFLPGSFYETDIARVAGTALGGDQFAWAINGGLRVGF
jgi:hypothetical protein